MTSMAKMRNDELNDSLDDLLGGPVTGPRPAPPEHYQPQDFTEPCKKCRGSGVWRPGYPCFACKGKGKLTFKTSPAQRAQKRASAGDRKAANAAAALEAFKTEHPDVWAWMDGSEYPFAVSLRDGLAKYGSLTDGQLAAARRSIEKLAAAKAAAVTRVETAKTIDMSKIEAAFARAGALLKRPCLRVAGFTIYPAKAESRNAGSLYVRGLAGDKSENVYVGRIAAGKFIRSRECTPEQEARLLDVAADPQKAAVAYGRLTGACACCGRTLSNAESLARGIGPICAETFGW